DRETPDHRQDGGGALMKRFTMLGCLLVLVAAPCLRADDVKAKPVTVPFELLKSGHMAVMVKIEGKGPYRMIFDTRAPTLLLNTKVAKEAGLVGKEKKPGFGLFAMPEQVKAKELIVGDVKAENVPAIVMDHPTVGALAEALGPLEGIIGLPFFARYQM